MLDRLFAAMTSGPSLNCRPHSSRQRVDITQLGKLQDLSPEEVLRLLLGAERKVQLIGRVPPPQKKLSKIDPQQPVDPEAKIQIDAYSAQHSVLSKIAGIAEDAKTYEQDTGVHVLSLGFPLLALPAAAIGSSGATSRRVIAPVAFVPILLTVTRGPKSSISIECQSDGSELITPNIALLAWLGQQTGRTFEDLFPDETGTDPWREISEIVQKLCGAMEIAIPEIFQPAPPPETESSLAGTAQTTPETKPAPAIPPNLRLTPAPKSDDEDTKPRIVTAAVLGLFPAANQGLLRDTQALVAGEAAAGPIESFLRAGINLESLGTDLNIDFATRRLIASADPFQARAVEMARTCKGLVIHGPPGTGKSQTITNIIGDHLSRGQRVLMVCDKRTALDVVYNRLEHMGLGPLCALIHDPQRDQRELYRAVRERLDTLADVKFKTNAQRDLGRNEQELNDTHDELTRFHDALMTRDDALGNSFSELVGRWLGARVDEAVEIDGESIAGLSLAVVESNEQRLREALSRGLQVRWVDNPWVMAAGINIAQYLARPLASVRQALDGCAQSAGECDATRHASIPPFDLVLDLQTQIDARLQLSARIKELELRCDAPTRARWSKQDLEKIRRARIKLDETTPLLQALRQAKLDPELMLGVRTQLPPIGSLAPKLLALDEYLAVAGKWYAFIKFAEKSRATGVLREHGLALSPANAQRLHGFVSGLRTRLMLQEHHAALAGEQSPGGLVDDEILESTITAHRDLFDLLIQIRADTSLRGFADRVIAAFSNAELLPTLQDGLSRSPPRGKAIGALEASFIKAELFAAEYRSNVAGSARGGGGVGAVESAGDVGVAPEESIRLPSPHALRDRLDTLEGVLRIKQLLIKMPAALAPATQSLLGQSVDPDAGATAVNRSILSREIAQKLATDPTLQAIDSQRVQALFDRHRKLTESKQQIIRDLILGLWTARQQERLLASTGSRLNSLGADLKRRLMLRGERAMRLRQVISIGSGIEGGDPLFDLCPVWMCSPETVAQVFPRAALFDVVIFDEASQCRLEEALPVLLRARRVVIAGDPKQLPPTRFFESAVASGIEEEPTTDQELFEAQQSENEDLLSASLNLELDQCYLDVHYRSRHADLIEFSNKHFYASRLQSLPGHPSRRRPTAPLRLVRVDGAYVERRNNTEAQKVVEIVAELLSRATPPSIGVACFNLTQRETILEALDEAGARDPAFAQRFAVARVRRGEGSFEGLFVKNLENVQGDERDHIIISTTYGRDQEGRFYRRFGPLAMMGGGRRLNVLVTRAREQIHIVTSIPSEVYRADWPLDPGQQPNGGLLLFHYLRWAENLATAYAERSDADLSHEGARPRLVVNDTAYRSTVVDALGHLLTARSCITEAYWGNDGFCVDLALRAADAPETAMIGVLCDSSRFDKATDRIEWDLFRSVVLEDQGWTLRRVCSPQLFRDLQGTLSGLTITTRTQDQAVSQHD